MRNRITLALLGLLLLAVPVVAAPASPAKPPPAEFPACGVKVDKHVIRPGEALAIVFGVAGPPDSVRAMRSKKEADDYVLFAYFTQGFSVDINSKSNTIQGILIESREAVVEGVPFKVGDPKAGVVKAWGEPDRTQSNVLAYWKRGVYVGYDEAGNIINLFLAPPGKVDEPKGPAGPGAG